MGYWALKIKDGSFLGTERFAVDLFLKDVLGRINDLQAGADGRTLDGDEALPRGGQPSIFRPYHQPQRPR